ncbi:SAM-dependent methyltransferase [Amycolatopsis bartoniae]|uniref:Methyltransferase n=1 Tax=Amycolatopsis bartoniae TaxID=941986 RepID=A0A8H9J1G2_9PSEU|nr:class I SAM-dependent methyltransferase [Amycolatopsis bartoniae]MBB2933527.1 SAM-dependent methyltransferase [Amycolatopsis bartoniae]TVT07624.1 class I SAM-dependent methyltransferase [Amycolatopsis bartoniae]GHF60104.1 methyltransferase [Amycolatopsis bartoniae]
MTTWDYTTLAATYSLRPPYAPRAIDRIVGLAATAHPRAADIGAGTGHLTLDLLARGCRVDAVEPNAAMAEVGRSRTAEHDQVGWSAGTGEESGLPGFTYDLVTFGSSFNTTDRPAALRESARLLVDRGHLACLWNHRQLDDPLQFEIESLIRSRVPGYSYGLRREDQGPVIEKSGLFGEVTVIEEPILHEVAATDWLAAWRSHATLQRQAGPLFDDLVSEIERIALSLGQEVLDVPYLTVGWTARLLEGRP